MISLKNAAFDLGKRTAQQAYCVEVPLKQHELTKQTGTPMNTNGATAGGY
jgi:hypothetical protein